jgi:cell shape-determining protein MreC
MSYLLDRKTKRNNSIKIIILVVFLFTLFYFRSGVSRGLSGVVHVVFRPILSLGGSIGTKLEGINAFFESKKTLSLENDRLKTKISEMEGLISSNSAVLAEDAQLKEILLRKNESTPMILAGILAKPNQSAYDTLIVDAGSDDGVSTGALVFANGNVPIGRVDGVYSDSSKIVLFSSPKVETQVVVSGEANKDIFMQLVGRGGGNFEMTLLRDFNLPKGTEVVLPGITPHVVGRVETIISDPRDAFQKALLVSPINIQELKFVQIVQK